MWTTSTPYTIILLAASAMTAFYALYGFTRRRSPAALPFAGLAAAATFHAFGSAFELASVDMAGKIFWTRIEYIGIVFIPVFWLLLAARFSGRDKDLTKTVLGTMIFLSTLTLALNYTNDWHHLYYTSLSLDTSGSFPVIVIGKGVWYWVNQVYINLGLLAGTIMFIAGYGRGSLTYRRQARLMITASLFPWIGFLAYLAGASPHHIDLTPFGMALSLPFFALALFRYRLLDIVPIAREAVFTGMSDGVIVMDVACRLIDFNPAASRLFPQLDGRLIGEPVVAVMKDHPEILDLLRAGQDAAAEIRVDRGDDHPFFHIRISPITNRRGRMIGRALLFSETTEQVMLREKLRALATIDELTGACNRSHFAEQGRKEIARAKRHERALSAIIIDLDHFKAINDRWGHEAGDVVLRGSSGRIRNELRAADIFGRHGGDEFAILLPETPPDQAGLVAERLRKTLAEMPYRLLSGASVNLTASLGTAGVAAVGAQTLEDLIRAADRAMYQAKSAGRDCVRSASEVPSIPV
jgi:diguanylate cyclase (GGDEF)-like protein